MVAQVLHLFQKSSFRTYWNIHLFTFQTGIPSVCHIRTPFQSLSLHFSRAAAADASFPTESAASPPDGCGWNSATALFSLAKRLSATITRFRQQTKQTGLFFALKWREPPMAAACFFTQQNWSDKCKLSHSNNYVLFCVLSRTRCRLAPVTSWARIETPLFDGRNKIFSQKQFGLGNRLLHAYQIYHWKSSFGLRERSRKKI